LWPFTTEPEAVGRYGMVETADRERLEIVSLRPGKDFLIARFKDVADRSAAERLRNVELFVPRERLPALATDEFYHADLIGLVVEDIAGITLGRIVAVRNFGAGDLLEIIRDQDAEAEASIEPRSTPKDDAGVETVLIPFTSTMVPSVDIAAGKVVVDPPPGLIDGN